MANGTQSYSNHTRWFPLFHFFVIPILLANAIVSYRHIYYAPNRATVFAAVVATGIMGLALATRTMTMAVQDRVIRLEMQLRLRGILPAAMHARISDLTKQQLVALRFASDAELADLVRDVLDGKLASQKAIKMAVKNWQGDYMRA